MFACFVFAGLLWFAAIGSVWADAPEAPSNLQVVKRTPTSALLQWTPGSGATAGFKIRSSTSAREHPDPTTYPGGRLAAFTWTTDDGYADNRTYAAICAERGLHYTTFVNPALIGTPGAMTWNDLDSLFMGGHEIASHTYNHTTLLSDLALALRYTGPETCAVSIASSRLQTWIDGALDLDLHLTDPEVFYLSTLVAYLDSLPLYEAELFYAPDTLYASQSRHLDPVTGIFINGPSSVTLTTASGVHDDAEFVFEVLGAAQALEDRLRVLDPAYECRSLAFPNHGHDQAAVSRLNDLNLLGARSGSVGPLPFHSRGSYSLGFNTTYEAPIAYPNMSNSWSEAFTRARFLSSMNVWKQRREWSILVSHTLADVDSLHLCWALDTIRSDSQIWIARFDEVMTYLRQFSVDVGLPLDSSGTYATAWLHDVPPDVDRYVVITAYNAQREESGWSEEVLLPGVPAEDDSTGTAVPESDRELESVKILAASPNPFRASTEISFELARGGTVREEVWDLEGRHVRTVDVGRLGPGPHRLSWNGADDSGRVVGAGVYWVGVEVDHRVAAFSKVVHLH